MNNAGTSVNVSGSVRLGPEQDDAPRENTRDP